MIDVKIGGQLYCGKKCSAETVHMRMCSFGLCSTHRYRILQESCKKKKCYESQAMSSNEIAEFGCWNFEFGHTPSCY